MSNTKAGKPKPSVPPRGGKSGKGSSPASSAKGTPVPPRGGKGPNARKPGGRQAAQAAHVRRQRTILAAVSVGVVVVVVAVLVVVGLNTKASTAAAPRIALTSAQLQTLQSVPIDTLVSASPRVSDLVSANSLSGPPLTNAGKPEVLFIGAEFCPICATERWPLMIALSKFGTFTNVSQIRSAEREYNIGTLSFYKAHYTSPYISLVSVEAETNIPNGAQTYKLLETPTAAENNLWQTVEGQFGQQEAFPFIDIGGKTAMLTYQFPDSLLVEKTFDEIYGDVGNNSTTIGANIDAAAAAMTKYICGVTKNQPSNVCNAVASVNAPISSSSSGGASSSAG